jgi:hypothetical protein
VRRRTAFWLAWCIWGVFVAIATAALMLQIKNGPSAWLSDAFGSLTLLALATVGSLIASRRPQNPIGWIFCASALLGGLGSGLVEYAVYALITAPGSLPAGAILGVFGAAFREGAWFVTLTFLLLLFPDGRLLSPRWRPLTWLIAALLAAWLVSTLLSPYSQSADERLATVRNPLGIPFADGLLNALTAMIPLVLSVTTLACIVAVVLRFRRAQGVERQQLKWFAYGMAVSAVLVIVIFLLNSTTLNGAPPALFDLAIVVIPISAGVAILRYRLFDIDLLINLTLVYGLLSATLLVIYLVLVFGGQYLLSSHFGPNNAVVLVVSTLLVAALFQPLRHRVQQLVDRRFYRSRYDAAKVMERFTEALRQEVDLEQLGSQLLQVVQETMQPAHLSLWLAPTSPPAQSNQAEDELRSTPRVD